VSTPAGIDEIAALSDAELDMLLSRLEREERQVSRRRTTLHDRIDFVRAGGFAFDRPVTRAAEHAQGLGARGLRATP